MEFNILLVYLNIYVLPMVSLERAELIQGLA